MKPVVYAAVGEAPLGKEFVAFIPEMGKGVKPGSLLPVMFYRSTEAAAREAAISFWTAETTKWYRREAAEFRRAVERRK